VPTALSSGGEKMEFDYSIFDRDKMHLRKSNRALIERYIMQDVTALYNLVDRFRERHGDALTQAGAALKTWETMGGNKRRYGFHHDAFFRPFYFGGRCQVFEYGAPLPGEFQYYDLISSYPKAMCADHPLGTEYYFSTDYMNCPGASFWTVKAISRGAFPTKDKNGIYFPNDEIVREYKITGWELIAALETNTCEIFEAYGHIPKYFETLKPYIDKFYKDKSDCEISGDKIGRLLAKLFLNSLYGKFAANPESYKDYLIAEPGERIEGYALDIEGDGYDILSKPAANAQYFDVALGASITGYARAQLWLGICASKGVVYCDTDSIICREFGAKTGNELGDWKIECEEGLDNMHIAGKKLYAGRDVKTGKWKSAHKGFSKLDTKVKDIIAAAKGEIVEISRSAPSINISGVQKFINRKMSKTERKEFIEK
jgi:hypothetical protein